MSDAASAHARSLAANLLAQSIGAEMATPVAPEVTAFVEQLIKPARPLGVLFYGSGLRGGIQDDTLLDFTLFSNGNQTGLGLGRHA